MFISLALGAEELFVMGSAAKILQPCKKCKIDYEYDLSNPHAIVLQTW